MLFFKSQIVQTSENKIISIHFKNLKKKKRIKNASTETWHGIPLMSLVQRNDHDHPRWESSSVESLGGNEI